MLSEERRRLLRSLVWLLQQCTVSHSNKLLCQHTASTHLLPLPCFVDYANCLTHRASCSAFLLPGVPFELVQFLDPRNPLLIGGLGQGEEKMGTMKIRFKRHR